ncbi:rod shape-determining protein MreD [Streptococcus henryi]|uniref:rod shape-determining protein MreD n=1 Tax=Streptococcus henryi TaxID=439219 RepID=UPI0003758D86|nr:rod shape-determining protein MreD [Streptococcus henryi]
MAFFKNKYFLTFILFILLILDGQISYFLNSILGYHWHFTSHLFLLASILFAINTSSLFSFLIFAVFGFLFDSYYLGQLGIMVILLPMFALLFSKITKPYVVHLFPSLFIFIISVFSLDMLGYFFAVFYGMTNFSLGIYIMYSVAPTLILNLVFFSLFQKTFKKLFFLT